MNPSTLQVFATVIFAIAVLHTFSVGLIEKFAHRFSERSLARNLFHLLSEVEAVFGFWALVLIIGMIFLSNIHEVFTYVDQINYTEPVFVFVIMFMAATRPIVMLSEIVIFQLSRILPFNSKMSFYITTLTLGPLMGSFITEPGAMTVCSMILLKDIYKNDISLNLKYATLGLLFVNVSIGGTLTHFAAPPVVMVAGKWGWGMDVMFWRFGYKALISVLISTFSVAFIFRKEFQGMLKLSSTVDKRKIELPLWIILVHGFFMAIVVYSSHHIAFFLGVFLLFLGFLSITKIHQTSPKLRESVMVGFFLASLVTLGTLQQWWLQILITKLDDMTLYLGAIALTAITDNAALTYLGSLVTLTESAKYFLVSGAVVGGGLTVIANAPNPVGYGILKETFGTNGISSLKLFIAALGPTLVALLLMLFLPNLI